MKHAIVFLILAAALLPLHADLFFSEYIEGSSNNKALEIYNPGSVGVDLTNYAIWRISNGGDWVEGQSNAVDIQGVIAPGEVWVICNSQAVAAVQAVSDSIGSSATYFNGNDAVGLAWFDGASWNLIDAVGEEGPDPGSGWAVAGVSNATAEHTLVRKTSITTGNTDWAASAGTNADDSEWIVYDQNTFIYLGSHGGGGNMAPIISNVTVTPGAPEPTDTVMITADVTDVARSVASVVLDWGTDGVTYPNNINMSLTSSPTYAIDSAIPAQADGTTVYYRITATDDESEYTEYFDSYDVATTAVVTIYDIQGQAAASPYAGQVVTTSGIVTAVAGSVFWMQDGAGAWNGVYVYAPGNTVALGDDVTVTAEVQEYYELTELSNVVGITVNSQGNTLPAASVVTSAVAMTEEYEGVLVTVVEASCLTAPNTYGEWTIDDGSGVATIDDVIYAHTPVTIGSVYTVTGPTYYSYSLYRICPRDANDVIESADNNPPIILDVTVEDENTIYVQFNEELEQDSAEEVTNYYIFSRVSVTGATLDGADPSLVVLTVTGLTEGNYTIEVTDVEDIAGNACDGESHDFSYTPPQPLPSVIITEVMQNPMMVGDTEGEWFEIYNNDTFTVNMDGWIFSDNGSNEFTMVGGSIAPGEYFVFGLNGDPLTNGGVTVDYVYPSSYNLGNSSDAIIITMADGVTEVDRVEWDNGATFPDPNGASMQFMGVWTDDNNVGSFWATATNPWPGSAGDFGTPGFANGLALDAPANVLITMSGADAVLTWDTVAGATTYNVYRGTAPDSLTLLGSTSDLTYTDTGAGAETKYYYYVTAE